MRPTLSGASFMAAWWWLVLAVCTTGCPHPHQHLAPSERISDPQELLRAVGKAGSSLKSLRAGGSIIMRRGAKRVKAHVVYLLRRPAHMRFETESFFDQPLSILVTDGMRFSLWDMDHGRFLQGEATPANISRAIPIPMDATEVVGLLAGDPPLIIYAKAALDWDESEGRYLLTLSNSRELQKIYIHPRLLRPTRIVCKVEGRLFYRLDYDDFESSSSVPRKIGFEMPGEDIKLRLRIREIEINPGLGDDLFELTPPEGTPIEPVEQVAPERAPNER